MATGRSRPLAVRPTALGHPGGLMHDKRSAPIDQTRESIAGNGRPNGDAPDTAMQPLAVARARPLAGQDRATGEQTFEMHVSAVGGDGQAQALRLLSKVHVAVHS